MIKYLRIGMIILVVGVIIGVIGAWIYLKSITTFQFGIIPEESIPFDFDRIEFTIPVLDEEGKQLKQTVSMNRQVDDDKIVKIHLRKGEVCKYEFINEKDLPEDVRKNWPPRDM